MNRIVLMLLIAIALTSVTRLPAAAAPQPALLASPCTPGGAYNPGCDADQDGDIDILDIQLTSGHWNQSGLYSNDSWSLTGNAGTTAGPNFLGTTDNQPFEIRVSGVRSFQIKPPAFSNNGPNIVGGYSGNGAADGIVAATIGGGGSGAGINYVYDNYATVSGGGDNRAGTASGSVTDGDSATVGGGAGNRATGTGSTIAGGWQNMAEGYNSTVAGGYGNVASGDYSAVAGGQNNLASGTWSFAAGRRAKAVNEGTFVWADNQNADFSSVTNNSFNVRAAGGSRFQANSSSYGMRLENTNTGDGLRAYASTSNGVNWAAVWANNGGSSPAIYGTTLGTNAGYFVQNIYVGGNCTGCELVYVAHNSGDVALETGDIVAATGAESPLTGTSDRVLAVRRAAGGGAAAIGVVQRRAVISNSEREGEILAAADAADGAIAPGDYLFVVVYGLAAVKADVTAPLQAGQQVTIDDNGRARAVSTIRVQLAGAEGVVDLPEPVQVIGVALDGPDPVTGLAPLMVALH